MAKPLPRKTIKKIISLFAKGESVKSISEELKIPLSSVYRVTITEEALAALPVVKKESLQEKGICPVCKIEVSLPCPICAANSKGDSVGIGLIGEELKRYLQIKVPVE